MKNLRASQIIAPYQISRSFKSYDPPLMDEFSLVSENIDYSSIDRMDKFWQKIWGPKVPITESTCESAVKPLAWKRKCRERLHWNGVCLGTELVSPNQVSTAFGLCHSQEDLAPQCSSSASEWWAHQSVEGLLEMSDAATWRPSIGRTTGQEIKARWFQCYKQFWQTARIAGRNWLS